MAVDIGTNEIRTGIVLGEMFYFDVFFTFMLKGATCRNANNLGSIGSSCLVWPIKIFTLHFV